MARTPAHSRERRAIGSDIRLHRPWYAGSIPPVGAGLQRRLACSIPLNCTAWRRGRDPTVDPSLCWLLTARCQQLRSMIVDAKGLAKLGYMHAVCDLELQHGLASKIRRDAVFQPD